MKTIQITLLLFLGMVTLHAESFYVDFQGGMQYNRILNKEEARAKANLTRPPRGVQDLIQNGLHTSIFKPGNQNYYLNYTNFYQGFTGYNGYIRPYSIYGR